MGDAVDEHIAQAVLVRVVGASVEEGGLVEADPQLHPHRGGDARQLARLHKLPRPAHGIMVNDPGGTQAGFPGPIDGRRRGIGGEGIGGMDVVVDHAGVRLGEGGPRRQGLEGLGAGPPGLGR